MSRFVRPHTDTLPLSDGDWIVVKKRLNTGEQRDAFARMYQTGADGSMQRHPILYGIHMVCAYLVDWSLTDDAGKPVAILDASYDDVRRAVDNLDPDDFDEVRFAIEQHRDRVAKERADAKKNRDGEMQSAATSPSLSAATGVLTTSAP
jgi:hypothetical protein